MNNRLRLTRRVALVLSLSLVFAACGGDDDKTDTASGGASADVEHVVRKSVEAENDKDGDAFVALFTDKGLEEYDSGTREEITSGTSENFGQEQLEILKQSDTKVTGTKATSDIQVAPEEFEVAQVVYFATFTLIKKGDEWLIDGFEFKGSPAPEKDATVVDVKGQEYSFALSGADAPSDVAFSFENIGKEQHELVLVKAPDGKNVTEAKAALENVDGESLENFPDGYAGDHVSFADIGQKVDVTFGKALEKGTYFMVCFIPQGGFGDEGPVNPEGKPHVQLGMISPFTVK